MDPFDVLPAHANENEVGEGSVTQDSKDVNDVECSGEALVHVGEAAGGSSEVSNSVWVASRVEVFILAESGPSDASPKVDDSLGDENDKGEGVVPLEALECPSQSHELISQSHALREAIVSSESLA